MKIACFADVHAHMFKEFATITPDTGNSRLDQIVDGIKYMFNYCKDNNITTVFLAGDLFHRRGSLDTVVLNTVHDIFTNVCYDSDIKVYMIPGNHDQSSKKDIPHNSLHTFKDTGAVVIDTPMIHCINASERVYAYFIPFNKDGESVKNIIANPPLDQITAFPEEIKLILVAHLGVSGAFVGANSYAMQDYFTTEDLHPELYKYGVLGHYHSPQTLKNAPHFFYCGSPLQNNFNDSGVHGFVVIDTDKRFDIKFVSIPGPNFITIDNYKEVDIEALKGNFVRFLVPADKVQELKAMLPSDLQYKIIPKKVYEEVQRANVKIGMSFEQIVTNYADEFNPSAKEIGLQLLGEVQGNVGA